MIWVAVICAVALLVGSFVFGFVKAARQDWKNDPQVRDDFRWFFRTLGGRRSD